MAELVEPTKTREIQSHGFLWEKELLLNVYGATPEELKEIKYTSKMDLPGKYNRLGNYDLSVKATGSNAVCMADCLRTYDAVSSEKPIHMVVIQYEQVEQMQLKEEQVPEKAEQVPEKAEQVPEKAEQVPVEAEQVPLKEEKKVPNPIKKIISITEVDLTNSRELLFGTLTRTQIEDLAKLVKAVPQKRKPTAEEYKNMYAMRDALQVSSGAIHLDIKCNSTQSRLQCSFNRFPQFIEKNPTKVIAKSQTHEFRGGFISLCLASSRRVFKSKAAKLVLV